MAEHTHTTYSCDRCKADLGSKRPMRTMRTNVAARFDYSEGPGPNFNWTDLCDACDTAVKAFFVPREGLTGLSVSARREGRVWMAKILAAENKDLADYMIAQMRALTPGNAFDREQRNIDA
jgi:hypothetical protein